MKLSGDDHVFAFSKIEIQMIVDRPIVQQRYCLLHQGKVFFFWDDMIEEDIVSK